MVELVCCCAVKSFSDENLTWCGGGAQQWKLDSAAAAALNSSPAAAVISDSERYTAANDDDDDDKPPSRDDVTSSASSLRMRVARAWSSRDLLDRLTRGGIKLRPSTSAGGGGGGGALRARRAQPHKVLSSVEPIIEFDPAPDTPPEVTSSAEETGSGGGGGNNVEERGDGRTIGDVLRQTVDFLVYEVDSSFHLHICRSRGALDKLRTLEEIVSIYKLEKQIHQVYQDIMLS